MRSKRVMRRRSFASLQAWTSPVVFGLAAWLVFPSIAARADLASLLAGLDNGGEQWRMVLTASPAGSVHNASLTFNDAEGEAALHGSGMTLPDGRKVAFVTNKKGDETTPDSERVNRAAKKGRIVATEIMQPPKAFTAGSVLERTSMLDIEPLKRKDRTAFVKPKRGSDVKLASFYFRRDEKKADKSVSPMLAELVTNPSTSAVATKRFIALSLQNQSSA